MTRYLMIMLTAFVFVIGSGCDSTVSSMEADQTSVADARLGGSAMNLLPGNDVNEDEGGEGHVAGKASSLVFGTVEKVGVDRIRVQGIDYYITARTVLVDAQGSSVLLSSITPGSTVKIEAVQGLDWIWEPLQPHGRWDALYVMIGRLDPPILG